MIWLSRYVEMEVSMMRLNILVDLIQRNGGVEDAMEAISVEYI